MALHNGEGATRRMVKADNCDQEVEVLTLIAKCIRHIKDAAFEQTRTVSSLSVTFPEIKWVITVPAIWVFAIVSCE